MMASGLKISDRRRNFDILAGCRKMLKPSIPALSKAGKKLKLHPNDRSVISVERKSANRPIFGSLKVASRYRLRISKQKTNNTK